MTYYEGKHLALIVPTFNRPEKVALFLDSVKKQNIVVGRIVIVASGEDIASTVAGYKENLPVDYFHPGLRGQIPQRNFGIAQLDDTTPLVACFDDDIELEEGSLEKMIKFWNQASEETAGVAFNIINAAPHQRNRFLELIKFSKPEAGKVLKSGRSTPITAVSTTTKTDWLCGGATVWKLQILRENKFKQEIKTRWAPNEDLIFSYAIGKKNDLYVCAEAKVRHEHIQDHTKKARNFFYSKVSTMWRLFFVYSYKELSLLFYLFESFFYVLSRFAVGLVTLSPKHFDFALGRIIGIMKCLPAVLGWKSWEETLTD